MIYAPDDPPEAPPDTLPSPPLRRSSSPPAPAVVEAVEAVDRILESARLRAGLPATDAADAPAEE